jgi:hypothetical protein
MTMRCLPLFCALIAVALSATVAAQTPPAPSGPTGLTFKAPKRTVFLNELALEDLRSSNPSHYAEAQRVMAVASELCAPSPAQTWQTLRLPPATCGDAFLRTSNPPKREISFQLDETLYVALVTVRGAEPTMHRLHREDPQSDRKNEK